MTILIYFLTIVFGIVCFVIMKNLHMQMDLHSICIIGYKILHIKSIPLKI